MRRLLHIASAVLAAALLLAGCGKGHRMDPQLYEGDSICLKIKNNVIYTFNPSNGQLGFNRQKCEFRCGDDAMNEYFLITCSDFPSKEGMILTASMEWTWRGSVQTRSGIKFRVEKTDAASSLVWLWSSKEKVGAVVKVLD
jgi:hypothetical protein